MTIDIPRPTNGDVSTSSPTTTGGSSGLLAQLRDTSQDLDAVRQAFADVLIAHGEAEEDLVYPVLRRKSDDIGEHEIEHGHEEHAEGNEALLTVLESRAPTPRPSTTPSRSSRT